MNINKITITGADDKVDVKKLADYSEAYPFVEWGILFSISKVGEQRYPSTEWIEKIQSLNLNLSAHFCGWFSKQILEESNLKLLDDLHPSFKRVQLNYNFKKSPQRVLMGTGWNFKTIEAVINYAKFHPERNIIFQWNKSNEGVLKEFTGGDVPQNINFLYDASGGRGTEIKSIDPPIYNFYTGYSGGLNVENINSTINSIEEFPLLTNCWIDLETGARTDNEFDLEKVETILKMLFIHKHGLDIFEEKFTSWLDSNVPSLNDRKPNDLLKTPNEKFNHGVTYINEILNVLGRIEYGIY